MDQLYEKDSPPEQWNKLGEKKSEYFIFKNIAMKTKYFLK